MKYLTLLLCSILFFSLSANCQVVLNRINFERVNYPNSWDESEKEFNQTIAYIINDYVKRYHSNSYNVKILYINNIYDVKIDDEFGGLIYQLQRKNSTIDYWLYLTLPDSCINLFKIINLIDLGFSTSESMLNCLERYVSSEKWFPSWDCYPSAELIQQEIDSDIEAKKYRFIKRMKRKYGFNDNDCICKNKLNSFKE